MIRFDPGALDAATVGTLAALQAGVDGQPDYASQVAAAKAGWDARLSTVAKQAAFADIKAKMIAALPGPQRCCYCEDSCADEIEHIRPKDWFPEHCFVWDNYLYACGPCNGPKSSRWAVIPPGAVTVLDAGRAKSGPVLPPPAGQDALIDPRREDPLTFLQLDLELGEITEVASSGTADHARAAYTLEVLRLNKRTFLQTQRKHAYASFISDLREYQAAKAGGDTAAMREIEIRIKQRAHRTVWEEMKRQYRDQRDDLGLDRRGRAVVALFDAMPETLSW